MASFIEFQLEDGNTIWVEIEELPKRGMSDVNNDKLDNAIKSVNQKFENAFANVRESATVLRTQLEGMDADEVTVTFGLKVAGEAGNFAIGKIGVEANYEVTLKWNNSIPNKEPKPNELNAVKTGDSESS